MFTGSMIDELIAAVERAESRADFGRNDRQDSYLPAYETSNTDAALAGVA